MVRWALSRTTWDCRGDKRFNEEAQGAAAASTPARSTERKVLADCRVGRGGLPYRLALQRWDLPHLT